MSLVRSTARTTSRAVRCWQPYAGRRCTSRDVEVLSVEQFNFHRALDKASTEGRVGDLEHQVAKIPRLEQALAELLGRVSALEDTIVELRHGGGRR